MKYSPGSLYSLLRDTKEKAFHEMDIAAGDQVTDPRFGIGKVLKVHKRKKIDQANIVVDFETHGIKRIQFLSAGLKKLK